jgi:NAD(P) transhydrogenase subunit alpha
MRVLVTKERTVGETRVAATPETVRQMISQKLEVSVEAGAGSGSFVADGLYQDLGATIAKDPRGAWQAADMILKVRGPARYPDLDELSVMKKGAVLIGFLEPHRAERWQRFATTGVTALSMELIPRITRAQKMDALSSQANIAGYKAVLLAAAELPRYFPLLMTAAGTVKPARVVVIGAGVAGLQAIATARRLGAVVEASDVRPAVKEQVQSLGAVFIEPPEVQQIAESAGGYARDMGAEFAKRQQQVLAEHVSIADIVITTALIPGKPAPRLVTKDMVERMRPGSVIVDLAGEQGGNCEVTQPGKNVRHAGVLVIGNTNLPATMPADASMLYARNVLALVQLLVKDGQLKLDLEDEIIKGSMMSNDGRIAPNELARQLGLLPGGDGPSGGAAAA